MGHDSHFLVRSAVRLDADELSLAMRLYQEPELLAFVMANARIPPAIEEVAVSLGSARDGPFFIVGRTGRFRTCLARGMAPREAPVLDRRQIAEILSHYAEWRGSWDLIEQYVRERRAVDARGTVSVLDDLHIAGPVLGRTSFVRAAAAQAFELIHFVETILEHWNGLQSDLQGLRRSTRKRAPRDEDYEALHLFWLRHWSLVHIATAALAGRHLLLRETGNLSEYCWAAAPMGVPLSGAHLAWAMGRQADDALVDLSQAFRQAQSAATYYGSLFGLLQVGLRHRELRSDALGVVFRSDGYMTQSESVRCLHQGPTVQEGLRRVLDDPGACAERMLSAGQRHALVLTARVHPRPFAMPSDVPEEIALAVEALRPGDYFAEDASALAMFDRMPWLAIAEPADIFPPDDFARAYKQPFEPVAAFELARRYWEYYKPAQPSAPAKPKERPNDPCGCGSGLKFKKCHGRPTST